MRTHIVKSILFSGLLIVIISCLEKKDIVGITTHPSDWLDKTSEAFHGTAAKRSASGIESCQTCHGENYDGGTSEISCYDAECHASYPHAEDFADETSPNFHGSLIREDLERETISCQPCHGTDYEGGTADVSCYQCHSYYPHKEGFADMSSEAFHRNYIKDTLNGDVSGCQSCHGDDYNGGTAQVSCYQCHAIYPHAEGFADENSANFHRSYIKEELDGNISSCQTCHGSDYTGGSSQVSCYQCHTYYPHTDGFADENSPNFHRDFINDDLNRDFTTCQSCHGIDYTGGSAEVSCYTCHTSFPHNEGFADENSENFHRIFINDDLNRDITSCQACHGADYNGATSQVSCYTCHTYYPHKEGFADENSADFHRDFINTDLNRDITSCQACHGSDYSGSSSQVSCYTCHTYYPHTEGFADENSTDFHQNYIANQLGGVISTCQSCHGTDYAGGTTGVSCYTCHTYYPHAQGFADENSANFHKNYIANQLGGDISTCQSCHGADYTGGTAGVSCYTCHTYYPHAEGFADENSADFHSNFIGSEINWDITECQSCHGADYAGEGSQSKNCLTCHQEQNGPEACSTCHGSSNNPAPPEDLAGNTATSFVAVGAHQEHLTGQTYTTNMLDDCGICHAEVSSFNVQSHVNDGTEGAEITFGDIASGSGMSEPQWHRESATCDNVYCHGAFAWPEHDGNYAYVDSVISGNYTTVTWNSVGTNQAGCGTCHNLPPQGHIGIAACANCHGTVVDSDLNIINKELHINGQIDQE